MGFDRFELSRQHYDEGVNQSIMKFEKSQPIRFNQVYESLVQEILPSISKVKNSCILTKTGVGNIEEVEKYVKWAQSLGVQEIVFRELSRFENKEEDSQRTFYANNKTKDWVIQNRVSIEDILHSVLPSFQAKRKGWEYKYSTIGYYYYNEHLLWDGQVEVIFETSSYEALAKALKNQPDWINKLIFHSNGNLTGDWDMDTNVIHNFVD